MPHEPQKIEKTNPTDNQRLEVVSIGYGNVSSSQPEAQLSPDQLAQVADQINATLDKNKPKWEVNQEWLDTDLKVRLD